MARLITWNVARRAEALAAQAAALAERTPDVVALQEITPRTQPLWEAALATIGLPHVLCTLSTADPRREPARRRATGVLLAAREPLEPRPGLLPVPWPETAVAALVAGLEVHTVHVPNAANGQIKPETLAAVRTGLAARERSGDEAERSGDEAERSGDDAERSGDEASGRGRSRGRSRGRCPRVLCGDLNTPRREAPDGTVWSFARDGRGRLRPERAGAWDEAELGVVPGLRDLGFRDAFRTLHGYASREPSWTWRRISGHGGGWRLDHLFCSAELRPVACAYHHDWRDAGLSDHSALEADVRKA